MKSKEMPSNLARQYVERTLPYEGTISRELMANRLRRAFMAGYDRARRRFTRPAAGKSEVQK